MVNKVFRQETVTAVAPWGDREPGRLRVVGNEVVEAACTRIASLQGIAAPRQDRFRLRWRGSPLPPP